MNRARASLAEEFPLIYQLLTARLKQALAAMAALFLLLAAGLYAQLILGSEDLFTKAGPIIGGDFMVFRHAASVAGGPEMASIYEMANLKAQLEAAYPGRGELNFAWMYPPTMSLVLAPFALPPYLAAFALWVMLFGGAFFFTASRLWADKWALFFLAASPVVFQAIITGQNGFLTATLLAIAGAFADRRPVLAGIAAGLLTIKPQLGLLVPVAFAAAGCWRAFAAAAATAVLLALASLVAFGPDVWIGFAESVLAHGARMGGESFPFHKLATPFGFAVMLGAPPAAAAAAQMAASVALAAYVFIIWRRVRTPEIRAAALATSAMLATPYAFYYELVIVAPALLLVAKRAVETGWLSFEKLALAVAWTAPLMTPGPADIPNAPACAAGALLAFLIVARRALAEAGLTSASAAAPAPAGS